MIQLVSMSKYKFKIGNRWVGSGHPCLVVAEMSANHCQDFAKAVAIIKAAKTVGADAIKLQTYTPDTLTIKNDQPWFQVGGKDNPKSWHKQTFYDLYQKAYMPWDWQPKLQQLAHKLGLIFFSTPFDATAVDFLETLQVPAYKIASYECIDIPLLKRIASTKKPVIMSVGFATLPEIELSVKTLRAHGTKDLALLYCLTSYQTQGQPHRTNLQTMLDLGQRFNCVVGFSDNMGGIDIPALAAASGASIIEKHLIDKHTPKAFDDQFSLDTKEFKAMVDKIRWQEQVMGKVKYGPQTPEEKANLQFRRSLFIVKDIAKGEKFTPENIRSIRPGHGLAPKYYDQILGQIAAVNIPRGTPLAWKLIKRNVAAS